MTDSTAAAVDGGRPSAEASEQRLSEFCAALVESGAPWWKYLVRHPRATRTALGDLRRLPRHEAVLGDNHDGRVIHLTLTRPGPARQPAGATGVAVLDIPADPADYTDGASKQTLRRKARSAVRGGATWRPVDDPAERRALLELAHAAEIAHADAQYRSERPAIDDLLGHDLWLGAFAEDGSPLMLSVTPHDGDWAHLRYFRTLGSSPLHSDVRYLMTQALVETLAPLGVRHVVDGVHPIDLPNGLRHFQRMVGFRLARVSARLVAVNPAEPELVPTH